RTDIAVAFATEGTVSVLLRRAAASSVRAHILTSGHKRSFRIAGPPPSWALAAGHLPRWCSNADRGERCRCRPRWALPCPQFVELSVLCCIVCCAADLPGRLREQATLRQPRQAEGWARQVQ